MFRRIGALKSVQIVSIRWINSIRWSMICGGYWWILQFWSLILHNVLTIYWVNKMMRGIRYKMWIQKRWLLLSHIVWSSFFILFFHKWWKYYIIMMWWHHSWILLAWIYHRSSSWRHNWCFIYHRWLYSLVLRCSHFSSIFTIYGSIHLG